MTHLPLHGGLFYFPTTNESNLEMNRGQRASFSQHQSLVHNFHIDPNEPKSNMRTDQSLFELEHTWNDKEAMTNPAIWNEEAAEMTNHLLR